MTKTRIISIALILIFVLFGVGWIWYYTSHKETPSAINYNSAADVITLASTESITEIISTKRVTETKTLKIDNGVKIKQLGQIPGTDKVYNPNFGESDIMIDYESYDGYGSYRSNGNVKYLLDKDILCVFMGETGVQVPKSEKTVFNAEDAMEICENYLKDNSENYTNYEIAKFFNGKIIEPVFDGSLKTFVIYYYYKIDGVNTSDRVRFCISEDGRIAVLTAFEFGRYNNVKIDKEKYAKAREKLMEQCKEADYPDEAIVLEYISTDGKNLSLNFAVEFLGATILTEPLN